MNKRTLKALKGSIAKWQAIVDGTGTDEGHLNCPLCKLFYLQNCQGCPVRDHTGENFCHGTPYMYYNTSDNDITAEEAAEEELAFLQSLLPEQAK